MKKVLIAIIVLFLFSCTKETQETVLSLKITEQPTASIETVSFSVLGTLQGEVKPIYVYVTWYKENNYGENRQIASNSSFKFTSGTFETFSHSVRVTSPTKPNDYYFAVINWRDASGLHELTTSKVLCK